MTSTTPAQSLHLGFLTVLDLAGGSYVGGLLVTNKLGRPLEFQCTTPVKPNRTQEILYGPTLKPFVYSELIGKTLIERLQVKPQLLLIDQPELLDLREHVAIPLACIVTKKNTPAELPDQTQIGLGSRRVRFHLEHTADADKVAEHSALVPEDADTAEPLERVREALDETLKGAA